MSRVDSSRLGSLLHTCRFALNDFGRLKGTVFCFGVERLVKIQDYFIISSDKLKRGWTLTTSRYTTTHIVYFKTQRTIVENTKVTQ